MGWEDGISGVGGGGVGHKYREGGHHHHLCCNYYLYML